LLEKFELGNPDASPPPKSRSLQGSSRSLRTPLNTGKRDIEFIDTQTPGGQWWNSPSLQLQGEARFELSDRLWRERRQLEEEEERDRIQKAAFQSIEQRRKIQKEERENKKFSSQLRQAEEIERVLESETEPGVTTDTSAVSRSVEKIRRKLARRQRKNQPQETSSSDEDLRGPFRNLQKVVYNLNDRDMRDDSDTLRKNIQDLDRVTAEAILDGFRKSFVPIEEEMDRRMADGIAASQATQAREMYDYMDNNLVARIKRIEDQNRLSTRVATEKKDQLIPLPVYPREDASDNHFSKAINHLNSAAKSIEKVCPFAEQPYNFLMQVAAESNQVAAYYRLSKNQQYGLIFSHIPLRHPVRMFLQMNKSLEDLLNMISTSSNQVYSRYSLEKMINTWRLENKSENDMFVSLATLGDLLNRNRDDYGYSEPDPADMMRNIITIIQRQEGLPKFVQDSLHEARLKIVDTDKPAHMYQILVAACHKYIGMKPKNVKVVESVPQYQQQHYQQPQHQQQYLMPQVYLVDSTPKQQNNGKKDPWWVTKKKKQEAEGKKPENVNQKKPDNQKKEEKKVSSKRHKFVEPWPDNCPYVSTNGNRLTKEFEKWFENSCYKCGHSSHSATKCRVYPEKTTILTLCTRCRQGLHENCKSKRKGLPDKQVAAVNQLMGQLAIQPSFPAPPPGYNITYSMPPPMSRIPETDEST
jgi:hypothetical protein